MTKSNNQRRLRFRVGAAAVLSAALASGGLLASPASPALAAPEPGHTWTFSDPNGANWTVPGGVSQVWVGIRGGTGGADSGATLCHFGGSGNQFSVLLNVHKGDVITTYSGQSATGSGDQRIGGKGYLDGGNGGKKSGTASKGGGGGGAGAVKLNGELIAVAGGGGGCGGESGYIPDTKGGVWTRSGGDGGAASNLFFGDGKNGSGKNAGVGGSVAKDDIKYKGYGKPGLNGITAGNLSSGGGGGGGGAGYPASGTGGESGKSFAGFGAGGGGGAGLSWVKSGVTMHSFTQPEDAHVKESIPAADAGQSKITIPLTTRTSVTGLSSIPHGESLDVRVRTGAFTNANSMLDGEFQLFVDGVELPASNPGNPSNRSYSTNGDRTVTIPNLAIGTHTILARFTPTSQQKYWNSDDMKSESSLTVTVTDPAPPIDDSDLKLNPDLDLELPASAVYGTASTITAWLSHDGDELDPLGEGYVEVFVDDISVESLRVDGGASSWMGPVDLPTTLSAGPHVVTAVFSGSDQTDPAKTESETFTVAQATTTTTLTAPASATSGSLVTASAVVESEAPGLTGTVELFADDVPLTSADIAPDGSVTFPGVHVPVGAASLSARFAGDADGNFAVSLSEESDFSVEDAATATTLELSTSEARFGDAVTLTAAVTNLDDSADPRGEVEILIDGEVVETIPVGSDVDPETGDGESVFELETTGLPVGEHRLHAHFVPAAGFMESATATPATLTVTAIETAVEASSAPGTTKQPATVTARVSADGEDDTPEGYVQAFVDDDATLAGATGAADASQSAGASARVLSEDEILAAPTGLQPVGEPTEVIEGEATVSLDGLPAGTHRVTVRFVPASEGMLAATTTVDAQVTNAGGGGGGGSNSGAASGNAGGSAGKHGTLSTTGGDTLLPLGVAGGALLLAAGAMFAARRLRRGTAE